MGALHAGHLHLVAEAKRHCAEVVVSIFVNPLQFGANEDFGRYPRPIEEDKALLQQAGADILYTPAVETMYPAGFCSSVKVGGNLSEVLCGAHRPGHFDGVATVVTKLFQQVRPQLAFFGEKDFQQLAIIRRVTDDLDLGVTVQGVPTVRDTDGLALSSRNRYLSPQERQQAALLPETLRTCLHRLQQHPAQHRAITVEAAARLQASGFRAVDYLECRHQHTLQRPPAEGMFSLPEYRLFVAAYLGKTRLIDNLPCDSTF